MGGSVIGTDLLYGYPGTIARHGDEVVKSRPVKTNSPAIPFGAPVVIKDNGTVELFGASNTAAEFAGIAVRKIKQSTGNADENFGKYYDTEICDVIERGSVMVVCPTGTPKANGFVYIRTVLNTTDYPDAQVGDIEAVADTGKQVILTNAKFFGAKDANNVVELVILNRQGV